MSEINSIAPLDLFQKVAALIEESRKRVATAVNTEMVYTYYCIGRYIVEDEQQGNKRAGYGKTILKDLSNKLTERYGNGWSVDTLENSRKLFLTYSISEPVVRNSNQCEISAPLARKSQNSSVANGIHEFILPWSHYLILMREKDAQARGFYEIEAYKQQWSKRQLQQRWLYCCDFQEADFGHW